MSETTDKPLLVIDATLSSFETEVLDRSRATPVVIDFWAAWCQPCLLLGPVLEKLAREYDGKFILAKVDTEREPELSAQFGVRSIPVVYGVRDGKVFDGFVGVQPEAAIRLWLDRLLPTPAEALAMEAARLELEDPSAAEARYHEAVALDPELAAARLGLARISFEQGRLEEAKSRIAELERRGFLEPEAEKLKAELTLKLHGGQEGGVEAARLALGADPDNLNLKLQLAEALAAAGRYPDALALCLELVERDRKGIGERARQTMVAIFQLLPADAELVTEYQRQLSLALSE
jgi:putative thioredoxin